MGISIWSTDFMIIFKGILTGLAHCDQWVEGVFHTLHSNKPCKGLSYYGFFYACIASQVEYSNRKMKVN